MRFDHIRAVIGLTLFTAGCAVGLAASSVSKTGKALISMLLNRPGVVRMTDTAWSEYVRIYRRSAVLTAAACGPALILMLSSGAWQRCPFRS